LACSQGRERKGRRRGRGGFRAAAAAAGEQGEEEKEGEEGRLTGGAQASATAKEKEKREGEVGRRGTVRWAVRPGWAERGAGKVLFFFLFHFQASFSYHFSFQIQIKLFQTFSQKFINFLETTQATKNHASQLMMHKHLLSLSLLNYV
jgi:hypothetical protein